MAKKNRTISDLKARVGNPVSTPADVGRMIRNENRVRPRTLAYRNVAYGRGYTGWTDSVYDLIEISRAADTESLLSVSFRHHRELMLKEGFTLKGKDPEILKVVRKRISEIEAVSNRTFKSIIRDISTDLIKFHSAFLYMRRDVTRSSGGYVRLFGKKLEPIAALEPVDPTSMQAQQNKSGSIIQWRQYIPEQGEDVKFAPDEIICITMDKKTGFVFGTPFCLPVLDDILTLRRLEELVDVIATKFAFPLLHYKVGTEKQPAQEFSDVNGNFFSEIDIVRDALGDLPTEGSIVTPERHEITIIGAEGQTLDLKPYLEYFRARVMAGLRLGGVEVGQSESTSKGSAVVITKNMTDAVKDYQEVVADAISFYLLREIMFEEGFDVTEENMVRLVFAPTDQEEQRAKENHAMGLYQGHAISQDEMRERMDIEPMTPDDLSRTYLEMVELPLIEAKGKIEMDKAKASAAATANKTRPANQSGKKATKTKVTKNDEKIDNIWSFCRKQLNDGAEIDTVVSTALNSIVIFMRDEWENNILLGGKRYGSVINNDFINTFFKKIVKKETQKIEDKISTMSNSLEEQVLEVSIFDIFKSIVKRLIDKLTRFSIAYGMIVGADQAETHVEIDGVRYDNVRSLAIAIGSQGNQDGQGN